MLVVDDDEYNRLLLLRYLPSPPFTVEPAANGLAATEAVARQWPDIVLIDMEMPVMNGLEAVALDPRARGDARPRRRCVDRDDVVERRRGARCGAGWRPAATAT